jgi:hypothetical protein
MQMHWKRSLDFSQNATFTEGFVVNQDLKGKKARRESSRPPK